MNSDIWIGIDEAGKGPLAGPVCVGLVATNEECPDFLNGIKDSKKLSKERREKWFRKIRNLKREGKLDFKYSMVSADVIDKIGITKAIQKALNRCCAKVMGKLSTPGVDRTKVMGKLSTPGVDRNSLMEECFVFLDGGLRAPDRFKRQKTIIKGDEKSPIISAASIVAKVMRDRKMLALSKEYPEYGFERHKGYGTKEHVRSIKKHGLSMIHRKSFISF